MTCCWPTVSSDLGNRMRLCLMGKAGSLCLCGDLFLVGCWFSASFSLVMGDLTELKPSTSPGIKQNNPSSQESVVVLVLVLCSTVVKFFRYKSKQGLNITENKWKWFTHETNNSSENLAILLL